MTFLEFAEYDSDLVHAIRNGTISYQQRLKLAQEFGQLVYRLTNNYISHRDLKPQNIFIRKINNQLEWVIGDFGLADTTTDEVDISGTPGFSSDQINYATNSDFYAAGITISFILFKEKSFWNCQFKAQNGTDVVIYRNGISHPRNQYFRKCFGIIDKMLKVEGYVIGCDIDRSKKN